MNRVEEAIFAAKFASSERLDMVCATLLEFRKANPQGLGPEGKRIVAEAQGITAEEPAEDRSAEIVGILKEGGWLYLSPKERQLMIDLFEPLERSVVDCSETRLADVILSKLRAGCE